MRITPPGLPETELCRASHSGTRVISLILGVRIDELPMMTVMVVVMAVNIYRAHGFSLIPSDSQGGEVLL